ncbi:hypothetical protein C8J56DRAFT_1087508, partial [Mycena floridula]
LKELLEGLKRRFKALGVDLPEMIVVDNCCHVRSGIQDVLPDAKVLLDVYHFLMRYLAVVLNGTKNPCRSAVAADIVSSILKTHAKGGVGATYWNQSEQGERLEKAFDKWVQHEGVWSAAATKVHADQLAHVKKGCLARPRDDILSDGSRIEGLHKGWNSLQRANPSGVGTQTNLGHDFVLRRNLRVASASKDFTDKFVTSGSGSHHVNFINYIAHTHNTLFDDPTKQTAKTLKKLPTLPTVISSESFGLVLAPGVTVSPDTLIPLSAGHETDLEDAALAAALGDAEDHDEAVLSLIDELQIDPKLFQNPQFESVPALVEPATVVVDNSASALANDILLVVPEHFQNSFTDSVTDTAKSSSSHKRKAPDTGSQVEKPKQTSSSKKLKIVSSDISETSTIQDFFGPRREHLNGTASGVAPFDILTVAPVTNNGSSSATSLKLKATPSQVLFAVRTGIDPRSLVINSGVEFFTFMDMRADKNWSTIAMNPGKWNIATRDFNTALVHACAEQGLPVPINKSPRALSDKLTEIEMTILARIATKNFTNQAGKSDAFWKQHCYAVELVKPERKDAICKRCNTLMYPGGVNSPENHKKGYCTDGVRQKIPKSGSHALPPWPQPSGIFTKGSVFEPHQFFASLIELSSRIAETVSGNFIEYTMEHGAFAAMLKERIIEMDEPKTVAFRLYPDEYFTVAANTSNTLLFERDDIRYLRVDCLN